MPIVYQAPDEVSPQISGAYGAAQQFAQDLPTQARLAEATAAAAQRHTQTQFQASEAAAHLNLQQQALQQQGQLARDQMGERAREADAGRDLQAAQFGAQLQQQPMLAQQHAQLQAWVGQQDLSAHEAILLRRMQNAVGEVQSDATIPADTKADLLFQLKTGIDPLRQRLESSQERQRVQQERQLMQRNALIETLRGSDRQAAAKAAAALTFTIPGMEDEDGNPHTYTTDEKGNIKLVETPKSQGAGRADPAERLKLQQQKVEFAQATRGHLTPEKYLQAYNAAAAEVDKRIAAGDGEAAKDRTAAVASALQARGLALSWEQQNARQQAELRQAGLLGGGNVAAQPGAQGGNVTARPGVVPPPEQLSWKSFRADDPASQNPQQRLLTTETRAKVAEVRDRPDLSKALRETAATALEQGLKLAEKYGSAERMRVESPAEYEAFLQMNAFLDSLPPAPPRPVTVPNAPTRREMYTPFPNG